MNLWRLLFPSRDDRMSTAWFKSRQHLASRITVEQVSIRQWPIQKRMNDSAQWNARRLRKQA